MISAIDFDKNGQLDAMGRGGRAKYWNEIGVIDEQVKLRNGLRECTGTGDFPLRDGHGIGDIREPLLRKKFRLCKGGDRDTAKVSLNLIACGFGTLVRFDVRA